MIQRMGEKTGAWTTVFSNDLNNLRYPKVKEYDAIFLNSIVGEFLPDPAMRADLVRYVNEGGGMGGIHGTPWASRNWDEFAEMIGAQSAPHRIENGILKVYDKDNPIVRPFNYEDLPFREEYYRFEDSGNGRLRWDKVRVLLIVDLDEKVPRQPTSRGPVTSVRTRCIRSRGSAIRQGSCVLQLHGPHERNVHEAGDRGALPRGDAVHPRRYRGERDAEPVEVGGRW